MAENSNNDILYDNSVVWIIVIPAMAVENVVCLLAISTRKRWKSPDVLLFSLILAHFLTLVLPLLLYAAVIIGKGAWVDSACKFLVWCIMSFKIVTSLQICFLSMDRVWTLKWPSSYRIHNTAKQSMRTVFFIWIFGLSVGTIPLLGWPDEMSVTSMCSLILNIGGYGYALCIVVIILGSFAVSTVCVVTIILHLRFQQVPMEGAQSKEFKQPIPEIVIESETGERTSAVQVSGETQNRQICILVSIMVTVEFFISGIPFVVVNLMALINDAQQTWMPASVMWCTLCVTAINPILLCTICQRYRRSYVKLGLCLGEACGCADSSVRDTSVGGIQRQETIDSLDNFSDSGDGLHKSSSSNFSDLSFSIDMDDEHALEYGITASMERDIRSLEMAGILPQDSIDFDNEAYIQDEDGARKILSSKERRAMWLAQKAIRRNHDAYTCTAGITEQSSSKESAQFLSVDRADNLRNHHRKLERNTKTKDAAGHSRSSKISKKVSGEDRSDHMVHTVKADIENGSLVVPRVDGDTTDWPRKKSDRAQRSGHKLKFGDGKAKSDRSGKHLRNGGLVGSQSCDTTNSEKGKKPKEKRRRSFPLEKEETVYSVKLSPVEGQSEGPGLRSARFDIIRDRMLSEMSSVHGSGELYDIPEEEDGEELQETSFSMTPGLISTKQDTSLNENIADKPFPMAADPGTRSKTPKGGKKFKKKTTNRKCNKKGPGRENSIDIDENFLTEEEQRLKKEIEKDEALGHFSIRPISSDVDDTDGSISEHSGYISSRESSVVSKMDTFPSIDASVEYDMDMIVIEQIISPPLPLQSTNGLASASHDDAPQAAVELADIVNSPQQPNKNGTDVEQESQSRREDYRHTEITDKSGEISRGVQNEANPASEGIINTMRTNTPLTNKLSSEGDPWVNQNGRPRANSAGAGRTTTAKDLREKYKRSRSERIILEPINSDSSQEVLYL